MEYGDAATWVGSVSALAALAFAAVAATFAKKTFDADTARNIRTTEVEEADQAAGISSWVERDEQLGGTSSIYIRNGSNAPVYRLHAMVRPEFDGSKPIRHVRAVLPPGNQAIRIPLDVEADIPMLIALRFTDASGHRWSRSEFGRLTKLGTEVIVSGGQDFAGTILEVATDSRESYGMGVSFVEIAAGDDLRTAVLSGDFDENVDAVVAPHDWVGELAAARRIRAVSLPTAFSNALSSTTRSALTVSDAFYGVPALTDSVVLIRNRDLLPNEPSSIEELLDTCNDLVRSKRVKRIGGISVGPLGDPFMMWPVFSAAGGALFGRTSDGSWDREKVLIDSPGSANGFKLIGELGSAGLFDIGRNHADVRREFRERQTPFIIDMYGALRAAQDEGIATAVCPVPRFEGGMAGQSFSLIYCFQLLTKSDSAEVAEDLFVDYLGRQDVRTRLAADFRLGPIGQDGELGDHAETTVPMPAFKEMAQVWRVLAAAEVAALRGTDHREVARRAGLDIRRILAR